MRDLEASESLRNRGKQLIQRRTRAGAEGIIRDNQDSYKDAVERVSKYCRDFVHAYLLEYALNFETEAKARLVGILHLCLETPDPPDS